MCASSRSTTSAWTTSSAPAATRAWWRKPAQLSLARNLDELLDAIDGPPLLLVLDGITDPHNLGACLRVADGAGAHAVIAPKDRAVGLNATAAKVASGAAETVPYITVTNLARTMRELKEREHLADRHRPTMPKRACTTPTFPARRRW